MTLSPVLLVALGGMLGALARYGVGTLLHPDRMPQAIPYATLLVNVSGSLLLGYLFGVFEKNPNATTEMLLLLVGVGFCGAYTTMSTFSLETLSLISSGHGGLAVLNMGLQLSTCLLGAWGGIVLGRR